MKRAILFCSLAVSIAAHAVAAPLTLTRDYTYHAGDADSKLSSRSIALEQTKRLLLEELGTYLVSNTIVRDAQLTKDEIVTYTAGAVVTVILDEKWDGVTYYLKAKLTADPDDVARSLTAIKNDQERAAELDQVRRQANDSLKEIERLKTELAKAKQEPASATKPDQTVELRRRYAEETGQLAAKEFLDQGIVLQGDKKFDRAVEAFSRAIDLAPGWDRPYAGRGAAYVKLNNHAKAEKDLEHAGRLNPRNMVALSFHGVNLMKQGKKREGMAKIEQAVAAMPGNMALNANMGWALLQMNQPRTAIPFLTKAIDLSRRKNGRAYLLRARAFKQLGDHDKARADLAMAESLGETPSQERNELRMLPRRVRP